MVTFNGLFTNELVHFMVIYQFPWISLVFVPSAPWGFRNINAWHICCKHLC